MQEYFSAYFMERHSDIKSHQKKTYKKAILQANISHESTNTVLYKYDKNITSEVTPKIQVGLTFVYQQG